MKLYHFSNGYFSNLRPMVGAHRHDGEDRRVINTPVIYLTTEKRSFYFDNEIAQYRYTVDLDPSDPNLVPDESLNNDVIFVGDNSGAKWFWYNQEIKDFFLEKWDEKDEQYYPIK